MPKDMPVNTLFQTPKKLTIKTDTLRRLGEAPADGKPAMSTLNICTFTGCTASTTSNMCC